MKIIINSVDRTSKVDYPRFTAYLYLTKSTNLCEFTLKLKTDDAYTPTIGHEVIVEDNGANKVFGGHIIRLERIQSNISYNIYRIECNDYVRKINRHLVTKTYTNKTLKEIVLDIVSNFVDAGDGFTTTGVKDVSYTFEKIEFRKSRVSECFSRLAIKSATDWFVDPAKDIKFFDIGTYNAPYDIVDGNGKFEERTLELKKDNSQVVNKVTVEGKEISGSSEYEEKTYDGIAPYIQYDKKFDEAPTCYVGGVVKDIGDDFKDNPSSFLGCWNKMTKQLKMTREDLKPDTGSTVKLEGTVRNYVTATVEDSASIADLAAKEGGSGIYEKHIIDRNVETSAQATQRAQAELDRHKDGVQVGFFRSIEDGFYIGQRIRVNSAKLGIDEYYIINEIRITMRTPGNFTYTARLVSLKNIKALEILQRKLLEQQEEIQKKEEDNIAEISFLDDFKIALLDWEARLNKVIVEEDNTYKVSKDMEFGVPEIGDWNDWSKRDLLKVSNTATEGVINYAVKYIVSHKTGMNSNFSDLRFTDSDGASELPYWIEKKTDGVSATVWVKVPYVSQQSEAYIYMYYGNVSATYEGDIKSVFNWGDDGATNRLSEYDIVNAVYDTDKYKIGSDGFTYVGSMTPKDLSLKNLKISVKVFPRQNHQNKGFYARYQTNLWGYGLVYWAGDQKFKIVKEVYGQAMVILASSNAASWALDTWWTLELSLFNNNLRAKIIDNNGSTFWDSGVVTDSVFPDAGKVPFVNSWRSTGNGIRIDDIIIRKYTSPEPTVSFIEQQDTSGVTGGVKASIKRTGEISGTTIEGTQIIGEADDLIKRYQLFIS